jgi:hypothetical protein
VKPAGGLAVLAALCPACLLSNDFFAFEDTAPVVALAEPEGFPGSGFGSVLAAYESESLGGVLAVGGNPGTDVFVFQTRTASGDLAPDAEFSRACGGREGCDGLGVGSAVAWLASFEGGTDCLAMGGSATDSVFSFCIGGNRIAQTNGDDTVGRSVAAAVGGSEVFVGGPDSPEKVYVWDGGATLVGVGLGLGGSIGEAIAVSPDGGVVAAGGDGEVAIFSWDGAAAAPIATVEGEAGFGRALVWGDTRGDGDAELHAGGDGRVTIVAADGAEIDVVECGEAPCTSFGDALATGDVDGDDREDLVVGWPARHGSAGAVVVFAHGATSGSILEHSTPTGDQRVGRSVAVVTVGDRGEVVAGAAGEVYYFFCSGLPGDDTAVGDRCRP